MTHFGALAAASSCRSPLLAVYHSVPVSSVLEKHWFDPWAHNLQQPVSAPSPTGSYIKIRYLSYNFMDASKFVSF